MSEIKVNFAALQGAEDDVKGATGRLKGQLDDLKRYVSPIVHSWTGEAAEQYQVKQRQWDIAAADLADVLGKIGIVLGQAEAAYVATENKVASMYNGGAV